MTGILVFLKKRLAILRGQFFKLKCRAMKRNIKIGTGLILNKKLGIKGAGRVEIGNNCVVEGILGDKHRYVTLYTHCPNAIIRIGHNARLYGTRISSRFAILIGDDVLIEHAGVADTDFHTIDRSRKTPPSECIERCQVVIGNRVAIGDGSIIGKGVHIGNDTIIAPGSVVTSAMPDMCFAAGNPAKVIHRQTLTDNDRD